MTRYQRLFKRGAELICAALFAVMFGAFLIQVFTRYVLNDPVSWSMEIALLAYIWIIFVAGATIVSIEEHISFDVIYQAAKPRGKRVMALITSGAILLAFLAAFPANFDFITFMAIDTTWILAIRFDIVFFCFLIFMVAVILRALYRIKRLTGSKWR
ncbi:MAG: TRAP transporter small permease subunit, partial [Chloroflexi bacterium]|nr:TRAP transporter small permease subunit [Chloroflexota bacterium]